MRTTTDRRLAALEAKARAVLRCEWCRYALRRVSGRQEMPRGANHADYLTHVCPWCGAATIYAIGRVDWRTRQCLRLASAKANGERFRDARVYAAEVWAIYRRAGQTWLATWRESVAVATIAASAPPERRTPARPVTRAPNVWEHKEQRRAAAERDERAALKERGLKFLRRMRAEEKRRHGPYAFPLAGDIKAILAEPYEPHLLPGGPLCGDARSETTARRALQLYGAAELCELALWGEALTETRAALAELRPVVEGFDAERATKLREQEERKQREEAERQRREDERRAQLAAREQPRVSGGGALWPNGQRAPETAATTSRGRFRGESADGLLMTPLTPLELLERLIARCGGEPDLESHNLRLFMMAQGQGDAERLMNLANVPEEERRRRDFSWLDVDGTVMPPIGPRMR
jgi:hypothetical protein